MENERGHLWNTPWSEKPYVWADTYWDDTYIIYM